MVWTLTICGRLPGLNEYITACRRNQYEANNRKKNAERIVIAAARGQLRGLHIKKPVVMDYTWVERDRRRDLDNISSMGRKIIQDALVQCGVLENDGWKQIRGFTDSFQVDKGHPRIEIVITEV